MLDYCFFSGLWICLKSMMEAKFDIATFIALMAFAVSVYQVNKTRKEYALKNMPLLQFHAYRNLNTNTFSLIIRNYGHGIAIVKSIVIKVDGEPIEQKYLSHAVFPELKNSLFADFTQLDKWPSIFAPHQETTVFEVAIRNELRPRGDLSNALDISTEFTGKVQIILKYRPLQTRDRMRAVEFPGPA